MKPVSDMQNGTYSSLSRLLIRLWKKLSRKRISQLCVLLVLAIISTFSEIISIGSIIPFIIVLTEPEILYSKPLIFNISQFFSIHSAEKLILPVTVIFMGIIILAGTVRLLYLWASKKLAFAIGSDFAFMAFQRSLYEPYSKHISRNSSVIISGLNIKIRNVVTGGILPLLTLFASASISVSIIITLIIINPIVAFAISIIIIIIYGAITKIFRRSLSDHSGLVAKKSTKLIKLMQESTGGIRDIILNGTQKYHCNIFSNTERKLRHSEVMIAFIGESPRYIIEAIGIILIATIACLMSLSEDGITSALPVLGAFALGAQRLFPAVQQAYNAWAIITGSSKSIEDALEMFDQPVDIDALQPVSKPLEFRNVISFESVFFRYGDTNPLVLNNISLQIKKGEHIGIIGETGCGKSTLVDLLLGLIEPASGVIKIDETPLTGNLISAWQLNIAHVPQHIYLADSSIAENIAFGIHPDLIDIKKIINVLKQAQIAEFIESRPEKYNANVGERGVSLSGGQLQRIGIARALYKGASVIILDEATSALDNTTEHAILNDIKNLGNEITIIIVAHRQTALEGCNRIIELKNGMILNN